MRIFSGRRRLATAVMITAALAGLAAGLVVGRGASGSTLAQGPPRVLAQGKFRSLTWSTLGTASLVREPSGDLRLRLSSKFMTKEAPETYVYLAKLHGQQRTFWKQVGELKRFQGAQKYQVSSDAAGPGIQVAIYCAKCNRISGLAPLAPVAAPAKT
jgi:hypothetical protein